MHDRVWEVYVQDSGRDPDEADFRAPTEADFEREQRATAVVREVHAYVEAHARDTYAGLWRDDDGVQVVAFTADVERHAAALGDAVRVVAARRSLTELKALLDRLDREAAELEAAGVRPDALSIEAEANVVGVEAVVDDPDAARRLLAERYGDAVVLEGAATPDELIAPEPWQLWEEPEPGRLVVHFVANSAYEPERVEVEETDDEVRVTVFERAPGMVVTLMATRRSATAELAAPVGSRAVVDGATGQARERV